MKKYILYNYRYVILCLMVCLWAVDPVMAQNGGFAGASTRIGFNARGLAMGNAMSAVTSEGAYAYYNPAQAAISLNFKPLDLTVAALKFDRTFQTSGIQLPLPPTAGLAFSILRAGVNDIDGRTVSGYPTSRFDISEYLLSSAFGIRLSERLKAGIGLKFGLAQYRNELGNALSLGIDLGALYSVGEMINVAFTVKDLFASYSWDTGDLYSLDQSGTTINNFPTRFIWGIAYEMESITLSGEFEIQSYRSERSIQETILLNGEPTVIMSNSTINTHSKQLRAGLSWNVHERISLRSGWQLPEISRLDSWTYSTGFSLHLPFDILSPSIDYAFAAEPNRVSNMHVFTLRVNL